MWGVIVWFFSAIVLPTAVAIGLYLLLAPSEPKRKEAGDVTFDLPTAEEGRPFPVLFGKCRIKGINALAPIFDKQIIYHESGPYGAANFHIVGLFLGVCLANIDGIKQIWAGDTVVASTQLDPSAEYSDGQTYVHVAAKAVWGGWGYGGGGGFDGYVTIQYGGDAQTLNSILSSKFGSDQPAYRGLTSMIFYGPNYYGGDAFYIGTAPYIRPISVMAKRTDLLCDGSEMWSIANANVGSYDQLNPIHMIYELITSTLIGRGIDSGLIGDSFTDAADTCYSEGLGVSCVWDWAADDVDSMIGQLEKIIDGKVYFSMSTEKYEIALNRDDYNPAALDSFGEDDFWIESAGYLSPGIIPSKVIIKWKDYLYDQNRVAYDDDIAMLARQNDQTYIKEYNFEAFVKTAEVANLLAARFQYGFSAMPKRFTLRALRTMSELHEGSVFKITYPELQITSMIVRVVGIDFGSLDNGEIIIECIEDVFGLAYTIYGTPPDSGASEETETTNIVVKDSDNYVKKDGDQVVKT